MRRRRAFRTAHRSARTSSCSRLENNSQTRGREHALALSSMALDWRTCGSRWAGTAPRPKARRLDAKSFRALSARDSRFSRLTAVDRVLYREHASEDLPSPEGFPISICDVSGSASVGPGARTIRSCLPSFRPGCSGSPLSEARHSRSEGSAAWPEILPDSKTVLFTSAGSAILAVDLASGSSRTLAGRGDATAGQGGTPSLGAAFIKVVRFLPTGHLVYGEDPGSIRAVAFDSQSLTIQSAPVSHVDGVYTASNAGATYFAVSKSGRSPTLAKAVNVSPSGSSELDVERLSPTMANDSAYPRLSPDGKRVAVGIDSEIRRSDIWIYDADAGQKRLTTEKHNLSPAWKPDGTRIVLSSWFSARVPSSRERRTEAARRRFCFQTERAIQAPGHRTDWSCCFMPIIPSLARISGPFERSCGGHEAMLVRPPMTRTRGSRVTDVGSPTPPTKRDETRCMSGAIPV